MAAVLFLEVFTDPLGSEADVVSVGPEEMLETCLRAGTVTFEDCELLPCIILKYMRACIVAR